MTSVRPDRPPPVVPTRVSVVIPTWNEASTIVECLEGLRRQSADEVLVVDAGSPDGTARLAEQAGARVLLSGRGRAVQQNAGALATSGEILLFLHADCHLEPGAIDRLRQVMGRSPRILAGCFRMRVEHPDWRFRWIDAAAHLRAGLLGLPYGDQAIFVRRATFDSLGGFPVLPLMEDLYFSIRMRRVARFVLLPARVGVSPRRWLRQGLLAQTIRNWTLTVMASFGTPAQRLARHYPTVR